MKPKFALVFVLFFLKNTAFGQAISVVVDSITIEGLQKTKPNYLLRELDFKAGDSLDLATLTDRLTKNRLFLMNNGPFSEVKINLKNWDETTNHLIVHVVVEESWRVYPIPILELADRNFNVWWRDHDHALRYLNYGIWLYVFNFSGRNDQLKIKANFGYSNRYEVSYGLPGVGKRKIIGLELGMIWDRRREIGYRTEANRLQLFFNEDAFIFHKKQAFVTCTARPRLFWKYSAQLLFQQNKVADTIATVLNPDFFLEKRLKQTFPALILTADHDRRDIRPYPMHGHFLEIELRKMGLPNGDLNTLSASVELAKWLSFSPKWSLEMLGKIKRDLLREPIPFYNYPALGYGRDYLRGYEYFVLSGADFAYLKTSVRFKFFERAFNYEKLMPIKSLQKWPVRAYLTLNNDIGFVNDPFYFQSNSLINKALWGGGVGLDLVARYSYVGQFEVSANRLGEVGFYFHLKTPF